MLLYFSSPFFQDCALSQDRLNLFICSLIQYHHPTIFSLDVLLVWFLHFHRFTKSVKTLKAYFGTLSVDLQKVFEGGCEYCKQEWYYLLVGYRSFHPTSSVKVL